MILEHLRHLRQRFASLTLSSGCKQHMEEPSTRQTEVLVDERGNNTWDPQRFLNLQRDYLKDEIQKFMSEYYGIQGLTIFRVPTHLNNYVSACKPMYISIGPYHRRDPKLRSMEVYKLDYLYALHKRIDSGLQIKEFIDLLHKKMKEKELFAKSCYSDSINMENSDEFMEMMLLDGCFIIELMFRIQTGERASTAFLYPSTWGFKYVLHDLLLLENQLPFFVLESIYGIMADNSDQPRDALIVNLQNLLFKLPPFQKIKKFIPEQTPDHLLHLFHLSLIGPDDNEKQKVRKASGNEKQIVPQVSLSDRNTVRVTNLFYRKATELELSGVKFKTKDDERLLHVKFRNGILEMSPLTLNEFSNTCLRNFVVLEQCNRKYGLHFTSYMLFIDNLVNSKKDVALLIKRGVFRSETGSNEVILERFFNRFSNYMILDDIPNRHLRNALEEMEEYCAENWHKWRAKFCRDYFNNPWSIASFVAAVLLLALTMLQASGTICRYMKKI